MIFKLERLHWKKDQISLFCSPFPTSSGPPQKLAKSPEMLSAQLNEPKINFCKIKQNSLSF